MVNSKWDKQIHRNALQMMQLLAHRHIKVLHNLHLKSISPDCKPLKLMLTT